MNLLCLKCAREDFRNTSLEAAKRAGWRDIWVDPYQDPTPDAWTHYGHCRWCFFEEKAELEELALESMDKHKWDKLPRIIKPLTLKPSDFQDY